MSRTNAFDQVDRKERANNQKPFDEIRWDECTLHCSKCKKQIIPFTIALTYYAGYKGAIFEEHFQYLDASQREVIRTTINSHPCLADASKRVSQNELVGIQARLDEIYKEVEPKRFFVGMHVINTASGHVWKLEKQTEVDLLNQGMENHSNILPYD